MANSIRGARYSDTPEAVIDRLALARRGFTVLQSGGGGANLFATLEVTPQRGTGPSLTMSERWVRVRPTTPSGIGDRRGCYRWTAPGDTLRLEHLRLGPSRPETLVDLVSESAGAWRSASPYRCGLDSYVARLTLLPTGGVELRWTVSGPRKDLLIVTRYRPSRR